MRKKRAGRPPKDPDHSRRELIQVRVDPAEKRGFAEAARLKGLGLSGWVRQHLRDEARRVLQDVGHPVPFIT